MLAFMKKLYLPTSCENELFGVPNICKLATIESRSKPERMRMAPHEGKLREFFFFGIDRC
jgi:hypothetical protein